MSKSIERFLTRQTPKTQKYKVSVQGGSTVDFTDVAGAPAEVWAYAQLTFLTDPLDSKAEQKMSDVERANNRTYRRKAAEILFNDIYSTVSRIPGINIDEIKPIARLFILELNYSSRRCPKCNGEGGQRKIDEWVPCKSCKGVGEKDITPHGRAEKINYPSITKYRWRTHLNTPYSQLLAFYRGNMNDALSRYARKCS